MSHKLFHSGHSKRHLKYSVESTNWSKCLHIFCCFWKTASVICYQWVTCISYQVVTDSYQPVTQACYGSQWVFVTYLDIFRRTNASHLYPTRRFISPKLRAAPETQLKGHSTAYSATTAAFLLNFPRSYPVTHTDTSQLTRDKQGASDNSLPHFLATVSTVKHPRVSICRTRRWKYLPTERLFLDAVKPNLQSPPSSRRSCIENICTTAVLQGK